MAKLSKKQRFHGPGVVRSHDYVALKNSKNCQQSLTILCDSLLALPVPLPRPPSRGSVRIFKPPCHSAADL